MERTPAPAYDALDRPTSMTYPDSTYAAYQYDLNGNVTRGDRPCRQRDR
jgi:YD repeat-containing protein